MTIGTHGHDSLAPVLEHAFAVAAGQLAATAGALKPGAYPSVTTALGSWETTGASAWTSGFFAGSLWLMYERTGDPLWRARAQDWQAGLAGQKTNTSTHDLGFMLFNSFGNGYRLTGDDAYRQVVLRAAESLAARYSPTVGCIRSWGSIDDTSSFQVIIDNMMNLELLFWAAKHGGKPEWYAMAASHAARTMQEHVRADGSTYHVVTYDPQTGAVKSKTTAQGYSATSTWSRGQAWAIYGFTMAYRETNDPRFLATARRVADYYLAHLPADHVPYWDFQAPRIPNEPRDSSAAAIAADGLLELGRLDPEAARAQGYRDGAQAILAALSSPVYLAEGTPSSAILLHGTRNKPKGSYDTGLIWGDYYFLEALLRAAAADNAPGAIDGRVANAETGHAISGARVEYTAGSTIADGDGRYRLAGLRPGSYRLNVSATGYISTTRDVSVTGGLTSTLDIALAPAPAEFGHTVLLPVVIGGRPSSEKRAGRAIWFARCRWSLVVRRWSWPTARR